MNQSKLNATLTEIVGTPIKIPVSGAVVEVRPMGWFEAAAAIEVLMPALATIPWVPGGAAFGQAMEAKAGEWMSWLIHHREEILKFCVLASGQQEGDIRSIPPLALAELVFGLIEVNADFFIRSIPDVAPRVQLRIAAMVEKIKDLAKQIEHSSKTSSSSSTTDTASPT
jgi:hypothetical protein